MLNICCVCNLPTSNLVALIFKDESADILAQLKEFIDITIMDRDPNQRYLCMGCLEDMHVAHSFKIKCEKSIANRDLYLVRRSTKFTCGDAKSPSVPIDNQPANPTDASNLEDVQFDSKEFADELLVKMENSPKKTGRTSFQCKFCKKKCLGQGPLTVHIKYRHSGREKRIKCPECGDLFAFTPHLLAHMRKHK